MFPTFRRWFIPSPENDFRPYILRAWPAALILAVIVGLYGTAQYAQTIIGTPGTNLAAVVTGVLVDLTNVDRAKNELGTLTVNPVLQKVAQAKANDMAAKGYFAHTSPEGVTPWHWFRQEGYKFAYAGENLAVYFDDSAAVNTAWMNSPTHRANILSPHFTEVGIAIAYGTYNGHPTAFVVQEFGAPSIAAVAKTKPRVVVPPTEPEPIEVEIIHEDPEFMAVKGASAEEVQPVVLATTPPQATLLDRVLTSPMTTLMWVYALLSGLVAIALVFLIVFEFKKQRPANIVFGVFLIILMVGILYVSGTSPVLASPLP